MRGTHYIVSVPNFYSWIIAIPLTWIAMQDIIVLCMLQKCVICSKIAQHPLESTILQFQRAYAWYCAVMHTPF